MHTALLRTPYILHRTNYSRLRILLCTRYSYILHKNSCMQNTRISVPYSVRTSNYYTVQTTSLNMNKHTKTAALRSDSVWEISILAPTLAKAKYELLPNNATRLFCKQKQKPVAKNRDQLRGFETSAARTNYRVQKVKDKSGSYWDSASGATNMMILTSYSRRPIHTRA